MPRCLVSTQENVYTVNNLQSFRLGETILIELSRKLNLPPDKKKER